MIELATGDVHNATGDTHNTTGNTHNATGSGTSTGGNNNASGGANIDVLQLQDPVPKVKTGLEHLIEQMKDYGEQREGVILLLEDGIQVLEAQLDEEKASRLRAEEELRQKDESLKKLADENETLRKGIRDMVNIGKKLEDEALVAKGRGRTLRMKDQQEGHQEGCPIEPGSKVKTFLERVMDQIKDYDEQREGVILLLEDEIQVLKAQLGEEKASRLRAEEELRQLQEELRQKDESLKKQADEIEMLRKGMRDMANIFKMVEDKEPNSGTGRKRAREDS